MKRMTKILSLALALALVLGMTAMAGTPSKIIYKETLSDSMVDGVPSWDKYIEDAIAITSLEGKLSTLFGESTALKGYINSRASVSLKNGKPTIETSKASSGNDTGVIYKLADPWTYTENLERNVALVASTDYNLVSAGQQRLTYTIMGTYYNTKTADATNTEGPYAGYKVDGNGAVVLTEANKTNNIGLNGAGDDEDAKYYFQVNQTDFPVAKSEGTEYNLAVCFAPRSVWGTAITSLNTFSWVDNSFSYSTSQNAATTEEVLGVNFRATYWQNANFANIMFYEISLDADDLYIENKVNTMVEPDDNLKITISQPIQYQYYDNNTTKTITQDVLKDLVISDGSEKEFVYGTDYTATLSNKVDGDAVKSVITIDMLNDMKFDTTYTVTLKNVRNFGLTSMEAANSVATFETIPAPSYDITLTAAEGLASGTSIAANAMGGKTVYFTANAKNTTGRAVNGVIVIGIYDAEGNLVKYAAASDKAFANAGSNSFSAAFKVAEGQTAKAFVKGTASETTFR